VLIHQLGSHEQGSKYLAPLTHILPDCVSLTATALHVPLLQVDHQHFIDQTAFQSPDIIQVQQ
jgi:hypothetical protein